MTEFGKLFLNGSSQAVRLPKGHRFPGTRVRILKVPEGTLLMPAIDDAGAWFQAMDEVGDGAPFLEETPKTSPRRRKEENR